MSDRLAAILPDRSVVEVTGDDAEHFLQRLVTNDVTGLVPGEARFAGLLSPQGKILFEFFVVGIGAGFWLETSADKAGELAKRLTFYKLRAKVEIADLSGVRAVGVSWPGDVGPASDGLAGLFYRDPRHALLGNRFIVTRDQITKRAHNLTGTPDAYHAHRIHLAIPEGGRDYGLGDTFPHEACFDQLAVLAPKKGCYIGQEVVSRMEHRGTARKRMIGVTSELALPEPGTEIVAGEVAIGRLGSSAGGEGLGLVRLDRLARALAAGDYASAGGVRLTPHQPDWARFEVPREPVVGP